MVKWRAVVIKTFEDKGWNPYLAGALSGMVPVLTIHIVICPGH
jgi:hypothetical protein